jgi:hypothetical protein
MNRYRFTDAAVDKAKKFLAGKLQNGPAFLKRYKGTVLKGKLYLDGKMVVPASRVDTYLRNKIYDGKTPMARDSAFYWISKNTAGIGRAAVDKFLRSQRIVRVTDNQQATTKRPKRRVKTKGQLHIDLVEVVFAQLPFTPDEVIDPLWDKLTDEEKAEGSEDVQKGYWFGCVDSITSLAWYKFAPTKSYKHITPLAKQCFKYFSEKLGKPLNKMSVKSDAGSEFQWALYRKWGLKTIIVKSDPFIEGKNSHFQRVLYRIAKLGKTTDIHELTALAVKQLNRTQSSITKQAPVESVKEGTKSLAEKYNKRRGPGSGVKVKKRKLVVGEKVRYQLLKDKDKGHYKAYLGLMWTKRAYKITAKRGDRYVVAGKSFHRDELKPTPKWDAKSEKIIENRRKK